MQHNKVIYAYCTALLYTNSFIFGKIGGCFSENNIANCIYKLHIVAEFVPSLLSNLDPNPARSKARSDLPVYANKLT